MAWHRMNDKPPLLETMVIHLLPYALINKTFRSHSLLIHLRYRLTFKYALMVKYTFFLYDASQDVDNSITTRILLYSVNG